MSRARRPAARRPRHPRWLRRRSPADTALLYLRLATTHAERGDLVAAYIVASDAREELLAALDAADRRRKRRRARRARSVA